MDCGKGEKMGRVWFSEGEGIEKKKKTVTANGSQALKAFESSRDD